MMILSKHWLKPGQAAGFRSGACAIAAIAVVMGSVPAIAVAGTGCLEAADAMRRSCNHEVREEYWARVAICHNQDLDEQEDCFAQASELRAEGADECVALQRSRRNACKLLGEDRYDPDFDSEDFTDEFNNLNPYFPLAPGNRWVIEGEDETVTIEVLAATKLIDDVNCIVVNDLVVGETEVEDTDDWYAQALNGDVYYCGEISRDFEIFPGDAPPIPELVAIDGSFKAGREKAEPGILMFANPVVGVRYRQEWALGEAEDVAEVLSNSYRYGEDPELDQFVPQELADLFCDGDCLVTKDANLHEPGEFEHKYYAPGIGLFLETKPAEGETTQLVECNLGGPCDLLP